MFYSPGFNTSLLSGSISISSLSSSPLSIALHSKGRQRINNALRFMFINFAESAINVTLPTPPIYLVNMMALCRYFVLWFSTTVIVLLPFLIAVTSDMNQCYIDHHVSSVEWLYPSRHCSVDTSSRTISSHSHLTSLPKHPIDFVFLIEYSQTTNLTYLDHFSSTLQSITSSMSDAESSDANFTVVLYSLEHFSPVVNIIHSILSEYDLKEIVKHEMNGQTSSNDTLHYSSKEMDYVAVDRSLHLLNAILSGDDIIDMNGQSHTVSLRSNANIHIIAGVGLYNRITNHTYSSTVINEQRNSIDKYVESIITHFQNNINVVLYFFFSRDIHPAREFIGSSLYEVRYSDCTHLNKALTLKALLDANHEANSLQAHLLALGRDINIMELSALTMPDCVRAINPIIWNGFDLSLNHVDKCSRKFGDDKCGSSDGSYCSPLHGCVSESTNDISDDRVPLTDQIVTSHADLAKTGDSSKSHTAQDKYATKVELSITRTLPSTVPTLSISDIVSGKPHTLSLTPSSHFVEKLIKKKKPVVVKNSIVSTWTAIKKWNFSYLEHNMGINTLLQVKCTNYNLTFDPDRTAPLKVGIPLPFIEANMSTSSFFSCIQQPSSCSDGLSGHYYFGSIPESLRADLNSTRVLFHTDRDYESNKQFMWISSSGMITHAHFDQDYNFFVQLIGKKRFTLWSPPQHELLYMYPRIHPLWHKSRINFRSPDLINFPNFAKSRALQVILEPGDVLYVPPYTWHYVESLSPSVSLSTWSHDYDLYHHMNAIYRHDHKFDLIQDSRGQMFALRLYLDMMIHDLYGYNHTTSFFIRLLSNRFTGLEDLFPPSPADPHICSAAIEHKIPTCIHVHGYAKLDMAVIGMHFQALQPEIMDILFGDYVEEITAQVVGVRKMLAFFRYCFLGQEYYITEIGDDEHSLWDHKDITDDSS